VSHAAQSCSTRRAEIEVGNCRTTNFSQTRNREGQIGVEQKFASRVMLAANRACFLIGGLIALKEPLESIFAYEQQNELFYETN
jgi:hypothetical protein